MSAIGGGVRARAHEEEVFARERKRWRRSRASEASARERGRSRSPACSRSLRSRLGAAAALLQRSLNLPTAACRENQDTLVNAGIVMGMQRLLMSQLREEKKVWEMTLLGDVITNENMDKKTNPSGIANLILVFKKMKELSVKLLLSLREGREDNEVEHAILNDLSTQVLELRLSRLYSRWTTLKERGLTSEESRHPMLENLAFKTYMVEEAWLDEGFDIMSLFHYLSEVNPSVMHTENASLITKQVFKDSHFFALESYQSNLKMETEFLACMYVREGGGGGGGRAQRRGRRIRGGRGRRAQRRRRAEQREKGAAQRGKEAAQPWSNSATPTSPALVRASSGERVRRVYGWGSPPDNPRFGSRSGDSGGFPPTGGEGEGGRGRGRGSAFTNIVDAGATISPSLARSGTRGRSGRRSSSSRERRERCTFHQYLNRAQHHEKRAQTTQLIPSPQARQLGSGQEGLARREVHERDANAQRGRDQAPGGRQGQGTAE